MPRKSSSPTRPPRLFAPKRTAAKEAQPVVWTIGHSNRELEDFLALLRENGITLLVDVRRFPASRSFPHFNAEPLTAALQSAGIGYRHMLELGGRRGGKTGDSPNVGWRVAAFNAYADHMQTEEFRRGVEELVDLARRERPAIMCSEAVPWRCHRRLIGDALLVRGCRVRDIMGPRQVRDHELTDFAEVEGESITYP